MTFKSGSEGYFDTCRVVMASSREAGHLQMSLFNQEIFGELLRVDVSKLCEEDFVNDDINLEDGSRSWKVFEDDVAWPVVSFGPSKVDSTFIL